MPQKPSPAQLKRFGNPADRVTPVDYTALPKKPAVTGSVQESSASLKQEPAAKTPAETAGQEASAKPKAPVEPDRRVVLSLNPEDIRPYARPLVVEESQVRTVSGASFARVTQEAIVLTVADPEEIWSADQGASDHFLRGNWVVQVRRSDNHVIGAFPKAYALAVRPADYEVGDNPAKQDLAELPATDEETGLKKHRRKLGSRHPGSRQELKARLESYGFVVTTSGNNHGKITHPDFPGMFTPWASTPSDRRHPQLVTAQVKRIFGIDIRRS